MSWRQALYTNKSSFAANIRAERNELEYYHSDKHRQNRNPIVVELYLEDIDDTYIVCDAQCKYDADSHVNNHFYPPTKFYIVSIIAVQSTTPIQINQISRI